MDFGKAIGVTVAPVLVLVVLGTLSSIGGQIPLLNIIACVFFPLYVLVALGILVWTGYSAAKSGIGMGGAAFTGAWVGGISTLINSIVQIIITLVAGALGVALTAATDGDTGAQLVNAVGGGAVAAGLGLLCIPGWALVVALVGAALGAVGALFAGSK